MDSKKITVLDEISECIKSNQNFVLQGGAGSGKTETLIRVLEYISDNYSDKNIACITHTNLAVEEITSRVDKDYMVSTIHSFLNSLIKNYKKNIHQVISDIFKVEIVERKDLSFYENETVQKKEEHKNYKKKYNKCASRLYSVRKESIPKVVGKRIYDTDPEKYNLELNHKIDELNTEIEGVINKSDYNMVEYNETRFDSFKNLTFSHDNLLKISSLLFEKFPLLSKIIQDKFDFIFIDEYQDTRNDVIDIFLNKIPSTSKTTIGLFGDSMQGIYDDGIGDVESYISSGTLKKVDKEDNYRCSVQVIDFINQFRNDGLIQEVAFKSKNGISETIEDRQGLVKLYYSVYDTPKPHVRSKQEDKQRYLNTLKVLVSKVEEQHSNLKKLMLTNKSIAIEVGFENLYEVFDNRYLEVKEEIEKDLTRLQLFDLVEMCVAYEHKNYNLILTRIKKAGFEFNTIADKKKVDEILNSVTTSSKGAIEVLELAFENSILKKSESHSWYINRKETFFKELSEDAFYPIFKTNIDEGLNTFIRMQKEVSDLEEETFNEYLKIYKKEKFYTDLFSDKIKFNEIIKYFNYLNENTEFITMHKTKGSGIQNVLVVLDEYFWYKYNFKSIFDSEETNIEKKLYNQQLFYVACSRAIKNLICVRIILADEEEDLVSCFSNYEKVLLPGH